MNIGGLDKTTFCSEIENAFLGGPWGLRVQGESHEWNSVKVSDQNRPNYWHQLESHYHSKVWGQEIIVKNESVPERIRPEVQAELEIISEVRIH